jgi:hypothetical protein
VNEAIVVVQFGEHCSEGAVASIVSGIDAYGNVEPGQCSGEYRVLVFRTSTLDALKSRLTEWERHGFLRWGFAVSVGVQADRATTAS